MDQNTVAAEGAPFDPARERTALVNALAEAARAALDFDFMSAAVLGAIPGTEPQQYVIAGTPAGISKMLQAVAAPSPVSEAQAKQPVIDTVRLRELAEAYRKAPLVFKTGERSHTDIALDAIVAFVAAARPTDDNLWDATLRDRDQYHEWADRLSGAIAIHFGVDIGEHSNMNCPWTEALDVIESAAPTAKEAEQASAQAAEARDATKPAPVQRDEEGWWSHPAIPNFDEDSAAYRAWLDAQGLETCYVMLESDMDHPLYEAYFEREEPDISSWAPEVPSGAGDGWFTFSIHDSEDGPVWVWARTIRSAVGTGEQKNASKCVCCWAPNGTHANWCVCRSPS